METKKIVNLLNGSDNDNSKSATKKWYIIDSESSGNYSQNDQMKFLTRSIEYDHAFSGYAMSYKVKIVDKKDLIVQLEASKSSIKDLFNDLLNETKGFKYQITVKVLLKKCKPNGEIEFTPVYFNSSKNNNKSQI